MPEIVVTNNQDFTDQQKQRLESLGDVTYYDSVPASGEEYLERVQGADIICSGHAGLKDAYAELKNVYVTVAFVSVAFVNLDVLRQNNVTLSNAPGSNKHAVSEWVIAMTIILMRNLLASMNRTESYRKDGAIPPLAPGLAGKNMTILGHGNVGKRVAELAQALDMNVKFFKRQDDLYDSVHDADIVADTLSSNPSTTHILDETFFASMKQGSYFVSITRAEVCDEQALIEALDDGHLAGAALDCGGILVGDTNDSLYKKYLAHPKIIVTPHIAYSSEMSPKVGADMMIDNVEAWINGTPKNVVT